MEAVEVADLLEIPRRKYIYGGGFYFWKLIGLIFSQSIGNRRLFETVKARRWDHMGEDVREIVARIEAAIEAVDQRAEQRKQGRESEQ